MNNQLQSTRLWEDFARVDVTRPESVRSFCGRRRFMLPAGRPDVPYVAVAGASPMRKFRQIHADFARNIQPLGRAYLEAMLRLARRKQPERELRERAADLAEELSVQSADYLSSLSPIATYEREGLPALRLLHVAADAKGGPHVTPEGRLTLTTPGHVLLDYLETILEGIREVRPILDCPNCGKPFFPDERQLGHHEQGHRTYCQSCAGLSHRTRSRLWMRVHRKELKQRKEAGSTRKHKEGKP